MALNIITPARDMMPLKTVSALLRETDHPASVTTLRTWIDAYGIPTERHGRSVYVSFSAVLPVHRDAVAKRG